MKTNFFKNFFAKLSMQLELFTKKSFLKRDEEMIFFDIVKKYTIFVQKIITQKIFKIQKKFLYHEKF